MTDKPDDSSLLPDFPEIVRRVRARTPARLLVGRTGAAYRTGTQLELRQAHAAARDAVRTELDLSANLGDDFVKRWQLLEVSTQAASREEYLLRPDLGRRFDDKSRQELLRCSRSNTLQIAIGDGLSITAIATQVPPLLPLLCEGAKARGWSLGRILVIRHCRVGILNEIGELLSPQAAVLLIGERPGLATAESMSAYMAYRPKAPHTDANRNLISNIHSRGVRSEDAAQRILKLTEEMMKLGASGYQLREQFSLGPGSR
jgi:ethanolamine ammonia-lyase small subunit